MFVARRFQGIVDVPRAQRTPMEEIPIYKPYPGVSE